MARKSSEWTPEMSQAWVTWARIGIGQIFYVCYVPNHSGPIGFVWGTGHGDRKEGRFEVSGSYVEPWARRHGVRTFINKTIFTHYPVIVSNHGSKEGGLAFLKASGYRRSKQLRCWYLERRSK
jgi:hypothetical protein